MDQTDISDVPRIRLFKRMWVRLHVVPAFIAAFGAALLYNLQDLVTLVVESRDICESEAVAGVAEWLVPKLPTHCHLLAHTELGGHPNADIAIVLDVYFVLVFFLLLVNAVPLLRAASPDDPGRAARALAALGPTAWETWKLRFSTLVVTLLAIVVYDHIFVHSDLETPPGIRSRLGAVLDEAAGINVFIFVLACWFLASFVLFFGLLVRTHWVRSAGLRFRPSGSARPRGAIGSTVFVALSLSWPPLWFGGVVGPTPAGVLFGVGLGLAASTACVLIRRYGYPRAAWAALVPVAGVSVLWSFALHLGVKGGPAETGGLWVVSLGIVMVPLIFAAFELFYWLYGRRTGDIGPPGRPGARA